jgi:hypothetical protein
MPNIYLQLKNIKEMPKQCEAEVTETTSKDVRSNQERNPTSRTVTDDPTPED